MNTAQKCMFRWGSLRCLQWVVLAWLGCASCESLIAQSSKPQTFQSDRRHPLSVLIATEQGKKAESTQTEAGGLEIRGHESNDELPLPMEQPIDLVQPPLPINGLNPMMGDDPHCSNDFWQQFPTTQEIHGHAYYEGNESLQARLRNGSWFANFEVLFLEPNFQSNAVASLSDGASSSRESVDFGFDDSYQIDIGFQSFGGTGAMFSYWGLNSFSNLQQFSTGGSEMVISSVDLGDSNQQFRLGEFAGPGSQLAVQQQIQIDSGELTVFHKHYGKVSTFQSSFAIRALRMSQILAAELDDPLAGLERVRNKNEFHGVGPKLGVEYFRPIGRTRMELQSGVHGSILVGNRDQVFSADGPTPQQFQQIGSVETIPIFELYLGLQWTKQLSNCRRFFLKTALESQYWANADSASTVGDDLGLYGASFGLGLTR